MISRLSLGALCASLLALALAGSAQAAEAVNHPFRFAFSGFEPEPEHKPGFVEFLEDPCGLALDSRGYIYVADYYHDQVLAFESDGHYINRTQAEDPLDGPCALAVDSAGSIYVNNFHRNVVSFTPSEFPPGNFPVNSLTSGPGIVVDPGHATGLALDPASGNVFVDERTHIAEYSPAGALIAEIATGGTLEEGYGLAISGFPATQDFLYAADAATDTVKAFDPSLEPAEQLVGEIDGRGSPQGGFSSLVDASLAIDNADGHVFVTDNLQSLDFEHPRAALDEFNSAGAYRGGLPSFPTLFAGEPSGLAIDNSATATQGDVYLSSGNTELASVYVYGPTAPAHSLTVARSGEGEGAVTSQPAGIDCGAACAAEFNAGAEVTLTAMPAPGSAFAGWSGGGCSGTGPCQLTLGADTEVIAGFEAAPAPLSIGSPATQRSTAGAAVPSVQAQGIAPRASQVAPRPHNARHHHKNHRKAPVKKRASR